MSRHHFAVLLVEDQRPDAALIGALLKEDDGPVAVDVRWVTSLSDALEELDERRFDAVLLDLTLPDARGLDALVHLVTVAPATAVVVLTGRSDDAIGIDALDAGAADCLVKHDLSTVRLVRALYRAVTRKRTERALVEQRNLMRSVLESLADAVVFIARGGRIEMRNPAAQRMLGDRLEEALSAAGEAWYFDGATRRPMPRDTQPWSRAARGDAVDGAELCLQVDGQPPRWLSANIRPVEVEGQPVGGVAVLRDITERRAREDEVRALNAELRRQIEERTRAVVALEAGMRLREQFLDVVSHELRTPLTPILGYARLLLRRPERLSPDVREAMETIEASATRLEGVVARILDFQALRDVEPPARPAPVDPRALLERVAAAGRAQAGAAPVEVRLRAEGLPAPLLVDGERLEQILGRLMENAVTFTPRGRVELAAGHADGALWVTVADSGVGIAPEHLDFIFGAFTQAASPETRSHGGLGLGLAHARTLAESLGGTLTVQSTPGEGSVFRLAVPASRPATATPR